MITTIDHVIVSFNHNTPLQKKNYELFFFWLRVYAKHTGKYIFFWGGGELLDNNYF